MIESSLLREALDISEVTRRTGLTSRALRFYEARGLVAPLRTASGRRLYGAVELERLSLIVAMKRAGLTIAQIQRLTAGRRIDVEGLIRSQLDQLAAQQRALLDARALLRTALSRIEASEPLDAATFCSLIRNGAMMMTQEKEQWGTIAGRYMSDEAKRDFAASYETMDPDFDQAAYSAKWTHLGDRIKAAQPLDPASDAARDFLAEWDALLKPFTDVATPAMMQGVTQMYDAMVDWPDGDGRPHPGFDVEVWTFMKAVRAAQC